MAKIERRAGLYGSIKKFALGAASLQLAIAGPATAWPLISEVLYDAVGSDDGLSFVELYGLQHGAEDAALVYHFYEWFSLTLPGGAVVPVNVQFVMDSLASF